MSNVRNAVVNLRLWPDTYHMGEHDRHVCKVAADALGEVEQLRMDNEVLLVCVKTATKYGRMKDPQAALNYLVRKLREAARSN